MADQKMNEFTAVSVPTQIYEKIAHRLTGSGFASVGEYITFVLNEVVSNTDIEEDAAVPFTKEDEENVKERLRALGYID